MKKAATMIAVLILCALWPLAALAAQDGGAPALDMVIVLDQSTSMHYTDQSGKLRGNDINGYRLEAASILLGMSGANGSRAAIVPFHTDVLTNSAFYARLMDISPSLNNNRDAIIRQLGTLATKTGKYTNIGAAMQKAVDLLTGPDFTDMGNRPLILLVTDGEIAMETTRLTAESKQQMQEAADRAQAAGIPIHTIALIGSQNYDTSAVALIAEQTGGSFSAVNNVETLPHTFMDIFAREIGGEVITLLDPLQDAGGGAYECLINIPSRSVSEANVMIGTARILKDGKTPQIELISPSGQVVVPDGKAIIRTDTGSFSIFKLISPAQTGAWKLRFVERKAGDAVKGVPISAVLSYEAGLKTELNKTVYSKNDVVRMTAYFEQNGIAVEDEDLYQSAGITASAEIRDEQGRSILKPTPMEKTGQGFVLDRTARELGIAMKGGYTVQITVEGDGLKRGDSSLLFTVENYPPQLIKPLPQLVFEIRDPAWEQLNQSLTARIDLDEYILDSDGDAVKYELADVDAALLRASLDRNTLILETTDQAGELQIVLTASDGDDSAVFTLPVSITSLWDQYEQGLALTLDVGDGEVQKLTDVPLTARVTLNGKAARDQRLPNAILCQVNTDGQATVETVTLTAAGGGVYTGSFRTTDIADTYHLRAVLPIGPHMQKDVQAALTVGNLPPVIRKGADEWFVSHFDIEPFWYASNATGDLTVDLSRVFEDPDNGVLSYAYEVDEQSAKVCAVQMPDAHTLVVSPLQAGSTKITLTAQDSEKETVSYIYRLSVSSLKAQVIRESLQIAAAALAALTALCVVIYTLKPSYGAKRFSLKANYISMGESMALVRGKVRKKGKSAMDVYYPSVMRVAGISADGMRQIRVRPAVNGIKVTDNSPYTVKINGAAVQKGKAVKLRVGEALRISAPGEIDARGETQDAVLDYQLVADQRG